MEIIILLFSILVNQIKRCAHGEYLEPKQHFVGFYPVFPQKIHAGGINKDGYPYKISVKCEKETDMADEFHKGKFAPLSGFNPLSGKNEIRARRSKTAVRCLKLLIVRANARRIKQSPIVHNIIPRVEACYPIDKKQSELLNLLTHHFVIFHMFKTESVEAVVSNH